MAENLALLVSSDPDNNVKINCVPFDVGRNRTAKLVSEDLSISRNHCIFQMDENYSWTLKDYSSSGTFVNNDLIGKGKSRILHDGDYVRIGPEEINLTWQFWSSTGNAENAGEMTYEYSNMDAQSQAIVDICEQKSDLEKRRNVNKESYLKMKLEKDKLQAVYDEQLKAMEQKYALEREQLQNQSSEIRQEMEERAAQEKNQILQDVNSQMKSLQEKLAENDLIEKQLKEEVQVLQEKMEIEKQQWEARFHEERKILEEKISQQQMEFNSEKQKVEKNAQKHEKELEEKLQLQEQEKSALQQKLKEMQAAHEQLSIKLKETNESHIMDKTTLQNNLLRELNEKEETMKRQMHEQVTSLSKTKNDLENQLQALLQKQEKDKTEELAAELETLRYNLLQTENTKEILERELANKTNSAKDEASAIKMQLWQHVEGAMESELQCSICSELFVIAITLNCTHTFCKYCINEWKKKKKNCPICREKIASENRAIVIDNYIDKMVESLSDEFKERRETLISERNGVPPKKSKAEPNPGPSNRPSTSRATAPQARRNNRRAPAAAAAPPPPAPPPIRPNRPQNTISSSASRPESFWEQLMSRNQDAYYY